MANAGNLAHEITEIISDEELSESSSFNFVDELKQKADNALIEFIDWRELNQCKGCDKYFEGDYKDDDFCSGECGVYYDPDRDE